MSKNAGKLRFKEFEISEDSDQNVGEEAAREAKKVADRAAAAVRDNVKKNIQKERLRREYIRRLCEAERRRKAAKKAAATTKGVAEKVGGFAKKHPVIAVVLGIIGSLVLVIFFFSSAFTSCATVSLNAITTIYMSSYLANDNDIDDAEMKYTELETDLQIYISSIETDYPYFDEYRYNLDAIKHDPYELMAYLTVEYKDFWFMFVEAHLYSIFAEQYTLEFVTETEVRTRTETYTDFLTDDYGNYILDGDGNFIIYEYDVEVQYAWNILYTTAC